MLSTNSMVAVKKAIESTYDCTCDVIKHEKYKKENKSTNYKDVKVFENKKCKLSFESITTTKETDINAKLVQSTKLFISPDLTILPGSRIDVTTKNNTIISYKSSGEPARYETHQEIMLELFESWA